VKNQIIPDADDAFLDRFMTCAMRGGATIDDVIRMRAALQGRRVAEFERRQISEIRQRSNKNLKREAPKITPASYAAAWDKSPTGNVADVARRMKVSRQNLSDWLKKHASERRAKK
jgi:hypothetical protein